MPPEPNAIVETALALTGKRAAARREGFTLLELMVVVVIIAFVLAVLSPVVTQSRRNAQGVFCMNNLKQLQIAWALYAEDHADWLPGVRGGSFVGPGAWVSGWLDFSSNPDNTNTVYLTDGRYAQLGPYVKSPDVFHCPADPSTVTVRGQLHYRVRSFSMNCWMNYVGTEQIGQDYYEVFRRSTQIIDPSPSDAWVFIDEHEASINDGLFQIDLKDRGISTKIVDYPANRHNGAAGMSFADGHTELKRWVDNRTVPVRKSGQLVQLNVASPDNPDVAWLQARSSRPRRGSDQ